MEKIVYNSITLHIPKRYSISNLLERFKKNTYEKEEVQLIEYFNTDHIVLELGSCLGFLSSLLSKKVQEIHSVEANPELMPALSLTKEANNCTNLFFYNCIVENKESTKVFHTYDLIVAGSADRSDYNKNGWETSMCSYTVPCKSMQSFSTTFNALVIDIEGGELPFFQDNIDYIEKNIRIILVELHGRFMDDRHYNEKCIQILTKIGFVIFKTVGSTYLFKKV